MQVKDIMTTKVLTINKETPIAEVSAILFDNNITGLPVVDEERKILGIITEYDLLSREDHIHIPSYLNFLTDFKKNALPNLKKEIDKVQNLKIEDLMTKEVVTVRPTTKVAEVAKIFTEQRINPLPVVDEDEKIVGIISRSDIIKLLR